MRMSIYKVVNVGQGDCIIVSPPPRCKYKDNVFFVDLGSGKYDVSKCIDDYQTASIFLTHSHKDHVGGLRRFSNSIDRIEKIYLPLFQNEIVLIANAILNMKAINTAKNCSDLVDELKMIVDDHIFLKRLDSPGKKSKIAYVWDGIHLCKHITCLNPSFDLFVPISNTEKNELIRFARVAMDESFFYDFASYIDSNGNMRSNEGDNRNSGFRRFWIVGSDLMGYETGSEGLACVSSFFANNISLLSDFDATGSRESLVAIIGELKKTSHDVCTVLKTTYDGRSMLLPGDASKEVFKRLIDKKIDISADYLKMPHHGSEENIDDDILNAINPQVYIISHNNRKFGNQADAHPNQTVLDMIKSNRYLMITNDIVKDGQIAISKEFNSIDPFGYVEIVDVK